MLTCSTTIPAIRPVTLNDPSASTHAHSDDGGDWAMTAVIEAQSCLGELCVDASVDNIHGYAQNSPL